MNTAKEVLYMQTKPTVPETSPLNIAVQAVASKGWDLNSGEDTLFQENVFFTARTAYIGYNANISQITDNKLHLELVIQLGAYSPFLRPAFSVLLNEVNQLISDGAICHTMEEDGSEYLVHRAQLYFDPEIGVTEKLVLGFMESCIHAFDRCLPHIAVFLGMKPKATFDDFGEVEHVTLKMDPEDVIDAILAGDPIGHA